MRNNMGAGKIAFLIGIVGALLLGILNALNVFDASTVPMISIGLIIAGVVIGILNVKGGEAVPVMVASLVLGGSAGILAVLPQVGDAISTILASLATVVLPAALVVAVVVLVKKLKN